MQLYCKQAAATLVQTQTASPLLAARNFALLPLIFLVYVLLCPAAFRRAAAMTAFTVALGAFGPGIASMSEPRLT